MACRLCLGHLDGEGSGRISMSTGYWQGSSELQQAGSTSSLEVTLPGLKVQCPAARFCSPPRRARRLEVEQPEPPGAPCRYSGVGGPMRSSCSTPQ